MKRLRITVDGHAYDVVVEEVSSASAPVAAAPVAAAPVAAPAPAAAPVAAAAPAPAPKLAAPAAAAGAGKPVPSPLSAVVVEVHASVGQTLNAGDKLITVEAMKMNTVVTAPFGGQVTSILVKATDGIEEGQTIATLA